jgi:hypothetical protein
MKYLFYVVILLVVLWGAFLLLNARSVNQLNQWEDEHPLK